jgi:hypothetical protein
MDAFESVVAALLVRQGYWVQTSLKVEITKEEKVAIGRHSAPRWELDVVGYSGRDNELRVIECKSFLDSAGVHFDHVCGTDPHPTYKLFTEPDLRRIVLARLERQLVEAGFCAPNPRVRLGLAAGRVRPNHAARIQAHFDERDWLFWDTEYIRKELKSLSESGYENMVAAVVSKLILR